MGGLNKSWYQYDEGHMNRHMAEHGVFSREKAFTWYDLEMSFLLWIRTSRFQKVCESRIIRTLELWEVDPESIRNDPNRNAQLDMDQLSFQAQNLLYMYVLWLVDNLDMLLLGEVDDTKVDNTMRYGKGIDCFMPIFASRIGAKELVTIDTAGEIRETYIEKRPIAASILHEAKVHWHRIIDTLSVSW